MNELRFRFIPVVTVIFALLISTARADLGLQQIMANQGALAVGQTVLNAAKAVYAGTQDPAAIQNQLIAIMNEAVATGNEQAIRYAIVAVMVAGGFENMALGKAAVDNSNAFSNYETLTALTVASTEALINAAHESGGSIGGGDREKGGGDREKGGGDREKGGGDEQGGGADRLFHMITDPSNPFAPGTGGGDRDIPNDRPATPT